MLYLYVSLFPVSRLVQQGDSIARPPPPRPGELLFVTDRPVRTRHGGDPRLIPRFSYMMGRHTGESETREKEKNDERWARCCPPPPTVVCNVIRRCMRSVMIEGRRVHFGHFCVPATHHLEVSREVASSRGLPWCRFGDIHHRKPFDVGLAAKQQ